MTGLRDRLRRLRPDAGSSRTDPPAPAGSLVERLRRLDAARRHTADAATARAPFAQAPADPAPIGRAPGDDELAAQLGAALAAPGLLLLERRVPLAHRHGRVPLGGCAAALAGLAAEVMPVDEAGHAASAAASGRWALLDTETSGLAGGTGTWVFTCGIGRPDGADLVLRQWLLTRLDAEPALLDAIADGLADLELLLSYNGKSFDVPLLLTRFRLAGLGCGLDRIPHLDLLAPVRRAFSSCWPDCRLAGAERRLLGFRREDDLPGAEAPAAWLAWLRRADPSRLGAVLRHNRLDLLSLAALVPALAGMLDAPHRHGADCLALARARLRRGDSAGARALLLAAGPALSVPEQLLLATLHRRAGAWADAVALWQALAARAEPAALEALAKYHEHRSGDLDAALSHVQRLPPGSDREHRRRRLLRKRDAGSDPAAAPPP